MTFLSQGKALKPANSSDFDDDLAKWRAFNCSSIPPLDRRINSLLIEEFSGNAAAKIISIRYKAHSAPKRSIRQ